MTFKEKFGISWSDWLHLIEKKLFGELDETGLKEFEKWQNIINEKSKLSDDSLNRIRKNISKPENWAANVNYIKPFTQFTEDQQKQRLLEIDNRLLKQDVEKLEKIISVILKIIFFLLLLFVIFIAFTIKGYTC